ncbi:hypothetical protein ACMUWO_002654 [Enterococcus faecalis]
MRGLLVIITIIILNYFMFKLNSINFNLNKRLLKIGIYARYIQITSILHELSHTIVGFLLGFKIQDFRIVKYEDLKKYGDTETSEGIEFGSVSKSLKREDDKYRFLDLLYNFIVSTAPLILAFIVFCIFLKMSNPDGLVILGLELFSFWDILMLPFNIFGFIGLKYYILLLVLFLVFFSFVSVLSTDDLVSIVDVRPKGFSLLMLIVYILIILAPDLILSSSVAFSMQTNILLLLLLFTLGFILGWLSKLPKMKILSHIKVIVIFLTAIPLSGVATFLLNMLLIFTLFFVGVLIFKLVLSILFIKFVDSSANFDIDNPEQDYQDNLNDGEEW